MIEVIDQQLHFVGEALGMEVIAGVPVNAGSLTIQDNAANPAAGYYRAITPP
jgi:hypothetical protein